MEQLLWEKKSKQHINVSKCGEGGLLFQDKIVDKIINKILLVFFFSIISIVIYLAKYLSQ